MSSEAWPTGAVSFLFTDVEDSTRRWREDEAAIIRRIDELLADALVAIDWFIDRHDWHEMISSKGFARSARSSTR